MGTKTNTLETAVLNHFVRGVSQTSPTSVWLGLFTIEPGETGAGSGEVLTSGTNYGRIQITFGAPSGGAVANTGTPLFGQASATWGTVVAWGLFDAQTSGNLFYWGLITPNKDIATNDTPSFATGAIVISED